MSQSHREQRSIDIAGAHRNVVESDTPTGEVKLLAPVLDAALLARVHQLNLDYLELLAAERAATHGSTQLQHLPPRARTAFGALTPRAMGALAEMPYTLYSLGFEEENFWSAVSDGAATATSASAVDRYAKVGDGSAQYAFCKLALVQAWHVAATNAMAARMVYAMPHSVVRRFTNTPLWQIMRIAASYGELMMPRWPTNPAFWPDLVRFAGSNDSRRLQMTRLLGVQLIAAELEIACEISRRSSRIAPALASPRLRARKSQLSPRIPSNRKGSVHDESK